MKKLYRYFWGTRTKLQKHCLLWSIFFMGFAFWVSVANADYYEDQQRQDELKYNGYDNKWSYEKKDTDLKYNGYENKWEYAEPNEQPKWNGFENKWEYAD